MDTITQFGTFESGVEAGLLLAGLFRELGTDIDSLPKPSSEELDHIFEFIWTQNTISRPYPSVVGFFSTVLRRSEYSARIMHMFGTSDLINSQSDYAPLCHLPSNSGIISFGYWTGDMSDGDVWCLDIRAARICCVPVGCPETLEEARQTAYAIFHDFSYLEAFLRRSSEQRGWLSRPDYASRSQHK